MAAQSGRFVWYDLMTTDLDAATEFYTKVMGWGTQLWEDAPEGLPPYTMWTAGEGMVGGIAELPEEARSAGAKPHWIAYVVVDDVDATLAKASEMGATTLMPPMDVPTVGRMATIQDPQGATIAVFTPESELPVSDDPGPGEFSWHELAATDVEEAARFYYDLFGWQHAETHDMGPGGKYEMYGVADRVLGGMFTKAPGMPGAPAPWWVYYVTVADIEGALQTVRDEGGTVIVGPHEVPGGDLIAQCLDPQGAHFALHAKTSG